MKNNDNRWRMKRSINITLFKIKKHLKASILDRKINPLLLR